MDSVKILEKKILLAAERLSKTNEEKLKLLEDIKFLEEENKRTKQLIAENEKLKNEKKSVSNRIEKLLKKFDS